jgi:hypothetical protein
VRPKRLCQGKIPTTPSGSGNTLEEENSAGLSLWTVYNVRAAPVSSEIILLFLPKSSDLEDEYFFLIDLSVCVVGVGNSNCSCYTYVKF